MTRFVALLKGINVGAAHRLAMGDLRSAVERSGGDNVRTLLHSGNVVFDSRRAAAGLATSIRGTLTEGFDTDVPVLVRTAEQLSDAIDADPLGKRAADPARHLLGFFSGPVTAAATDGLTAAVATRQARGGKDSDDLYEIAGDHVYLWCGLTVHQSIFATIDWDALLGVDVTMRNWRTVGKLQELSQE